jgi:hypothetical protein
MYSVILKDDIIWNIMHNIFILRDMQVFIYVILGPGWLNELGSWIT